MKGGEKVLSPEKFQVGDFVRIKSWDEMCKDFDHDAQWINTPYRFFIDEMCEYCGNEVEIEKLELAGESDEGLQQREVYYVTFVDHEEAAGDWSYTTDMIKLVYRPKPELADDEVSDSELDLLAILNSI